MFVLGNGSNLLVADGEHDVLGVHLVGEFEQLRTPKKVTWWWWTSAPVWVCRSPRDDSPSPGSSASSGVAYPEASGAAVMNAGGHGSDMNESLVSVTVWNDGITRSGPKELLDYAIDERPSRGRFVIAVRLHLPPVTAKRPGENPRDRALATRTPTGWCQRGQRVPQPRHDYAGRLIEAAGCKGCESARDGV